MAAGVNSPVHTIEDIAVGAVRSPVYLEDHRQQNKFSGSLNRQAR